MVYLCKDYEFVAELNHHPRLKVYFIDSDVENYFFKRNFKNAWVQNLRYDHALLDDIESFDRETLYLLFDDKSLNTFNLLFDPLSEKRTCVPIHVEELGALPKHSSILVLELQALIMPCSTAFLGVM